MVSEAQESSYRKRFPKGKDWKDPKPNPFGHCGLNPDSYHGMETIGVSIEKYEEFEEKYLAPKTAVGKVGSAIGGTVGFVYGAPMKLGIRATAALARPVIRGIGKKTVKEVTKKATQEAVKGSHLKQFGGDKVKFIEETFGKTVGGLSHQSRWGEVGKAVNKNWVRTSSKAIDEVAISAAYSAKFLLFIKS